MGLFDSNTSSGGGYGWNTNGQQPWQMMMGGPMSFGSSSGSPFNMSGMWGSPSGGFDAYQSTGGGDSANAFWDPKNPSTAQQTTFTPWAPLGEATKTIWRDAGKEWQKQTDLGPTGFDPASTQALDRMYQLAQGPNPLIGNARNAVTGIAGGQNGISTGGMFGAMYDQPGISNAYQYNQLYNSGVNPGQFNQVYQDLNQPGMLDQGYFRNIAQGGQLSAYPAFKKGGLQGSGPWDEDGNPQPVGGFDSSGGGWQENTSTGGQTDPRLKGIPSPATDPNPYRSAALDNALSRTRDQIAASMSSSGRYGSSAMGDAMARGLGDVAANFNLNAYNSDQDRALQAAGMRSQEDLARKGLQLQAAQGGAGVMQGNIQSRLGAAQGLSGIQGQNAQTQLAAAQGLTGVQQGNIGNALQASSMADALNKARYGDAQMMAQVGGAREAMEQQNRDFGWEQLRNRYGFIGGLPGSLGTQTTQQPQTPWWQQLLGGGLAGLGALGGFLGG